MESIEELEEFYKDKTGSISVTPYASIECIKTFSEGHLAVIKHNKDKPYFQGYLNRLIKIKSILENGSNKLKSE